MLRIVTILLEIWSLNMILRNPNTIFCPNFNDRKRARLGWRVEYIIVKALGVSAGGFPAGSESGEERGDVGWGNFDGDVESYAKVGSSEPVRHVGRIQAVEREVVQDEALWLRSLKIRTEWHALK
jgi:hypothetical protein